MSELHQLLAIEPDLKARAQSELARLQDRFSDTGNYLGQTRVYSPLDDGGDALPAERKELPGRVPTELDDLMTVYGEWINAAMSKEITNTRTSADVEVDGHTVLANMPAPALLNLESKLAELKSALKAIPVNDIAERWAYDETLECFVSDVKTSYRTRKIKKTQVAYEATKEHPAQILAYDEDVREGTWETTLYSGMVTPVQKRDMLERLDKLIRAVKSARQRANSAQVSDFEGRALLKYIISG